LKTFVLYTTKAHRQTETAKQRQMQTDGHTDRHKDRGIQTSRDSHTYRQTDGRTDRLEIYERQS